ncbi:hypothetical protein EIP91_003892 [Steccherinum ochraceum]|uniref:Uncharacterized protein n=1 Tax=Steccherinum ochraceum TaxID=92696 RepID=A0A4R0RFZ8_9APHY|nr:hypothetical protein EIP91_003892 [Steccherinum ochraceum]
MRFFTTVAVLLIAASTSIEALPVPYAAGSLVVCEFFDTASKDADLVRRFCEDDHLQNDAKRLNVLKVRAVGHTEISNDNGGGTSGGGNNGGGTSGGGNNGGETSGGGNNGGGTSGPGGGDPGSGGGNGKRSKVA